MAELEALNAGPCEVGEEHTPDSRYPEEKDQEFTSSVVLSDIALRAPGIREKAIVLMKQSLVVQSLRAGCWPFFDFREEPLENGVKMKMRGHVFPDGVEDAVLHYCATAMLADEEKRHAS